jgi:hypothetical protein
VVSLCWADCDVAVALLRRVLYGGGLLGVVHLFLSVPYLCGVMTGGFGDYMRVECRWMSHLGLDSAAVVEWSGAAVLMSQSNRLCMVFSS